MAITKGQRIKYGQTWNDTKAVLVKRDFDKDEIEAERNELLKLSGAKPDNNGRYSANTLTNAGFSTFLDLCETTVSGKENQKRRSRSMIYAIEQIGLPDSYLNSITRDQFQVDDWRTLPLLKLQLLIRTAKNRAKSTK